MKVLNLALIFVVFFTSCGQDANEHKSLHSFKDSSAMIQNQENEGKEPAFKEIREDYISGYNKTESLDTSFADKEGRQIRVLTKYYCLFDSAVIVPEKYVLEDTTMDFRTHNYAQDIKIIINTDTVFNKTIAKIDFTEKLFPELKKHSVLLGPNFNYDKDKKAFVFGYSLTIPLTDVGAGLQLMVDYNGKTSLVE